MLGFIGFPFLQSVGAELHPEDLRGLGSQPQSLALPVNIQGMETNYAEHYAPLSTKAFVGCMINYGERRSGVALHVLQKGKIKISPPRSDTGSNP